MSEQTQRSQYDQIADINRLAGNEANGGWIAMERQAKLLRSELNELDEAIAAGNIYKARDGVGDIEFVLMGFKHRAGFPVTDDLQAVIESNLTKFDESTEECQLTTAKYAKIGIEIHFRVSDHPSKPGEKIYVALCTHDQTASDADNTFYPGGKWLKSYKFREPVFGPLDFDVVEKLTGLAEAAAVKVPNAETEYAT